MKKLILSLAALAFATYLFSQDDSKDDNSAVKQNTVVVAHDGHKNNSKLNYLNINCPFFYSSYFVKFKTEVLLS